MIFVRTEELRPGMRLAKPIYNKNGVLLYERNSRLTIPGINSVRNFGLIGIYILEPTEPCPPLSQDDLAIEQAQTIYSFKLRDIFDKVYKRKLPDKLPSLVEDFIVRYGSVDHRINFNPNLRSADDFILKHAISTTTLTTMLSSHIHMSEEDRASLVAASILYGFGYRFVARNKLHDKEAVQFALEKGVNYLLTYHEEFPFLPQALAIVEYLVVSSNPERTIPHPSPEILLLAEILRIAKDFDLLTGMNPQFKPASEIAAIQQLLGQPDKYNDSIVSLLAHCIHIIPAGASVNLSTKEKAIVLVENPQDYLKPLILHLSDNQLYDLSLPEVSKRLQIVDPAKTIDNRIQIDESIVAQFSSDERIIEATKRFHGEQ